MGEGGEGRRPAARGVAAAADGGDDRPRAQLAPCRRPRATGDRRQGTGDRDLRHRHHPGWGGGGGGGGGQARCAAADRAAIRTAGRGSGGGGGRGAGDRAVERRRGDRRRVRHRHHARAGDRRDPRLCPLARRPPGRGRRRNRPVGSRLRRRCARRRPRRRPDDHRRRARGGPRHRRRRRADRRRAPPRRQRHPAARHLSGDGAVGRGTRGDRRGMARRARPRRLRRFRAPVRDRLWQRAGPGRGPRLRRRRHRPDAARAGASRPRRAGGLGGVSRRHRRGPLPRDGTATRELAILVADGSSFRTVAHSQPREPQRTATTTASR